MHLRLAATFIASAASFLPATSASLLRGVGKEFDLGDTLETTEDTPGTFLKVSECDTILLIDMSAQLQ